MRAAISPQSRLRFLCVSGFAGIVPALGFMLVSSEKEVAMGVFKIRKEDKLDFLRKMLAEVSDLPCLWDPTQDRSFVSRDSGDEDIGMDGIASQFQDSAYRHREAFVATTLAVCAMLGGRRGAKPCGPGLYFLTTALEDLLEWRNMCRMRFQGTHHLPTTASPADTDRFSAPEFWQGPQASAYAVVHIAWNWYEKHMKQWSGREAERFLRDGGL
jgi:hypothetical protein